MFKQHSCTSITMTFKVIVHPKIVKNHLLKMSFQNQMLLLFLWNNRVECQELLLSCHKTTGSKLSLDFLFVFQVFWRHSIVWRNRNWSSFLSEYVNCPFEEVVLNQRARAHKGPQKTFRGASRWLKMIKEKKKKIR